MAMVVDGLSWLLLLSGGLFALIGGLGLLRLPDVYARMHAAGITDTLGAGLIMSGLGLQAGLSQDTIKLALILVFMIYTSPAATHALAKAAYLHGPKPLLGAARRERQEEPTS